MAGCGAEACRVIRGVGRSVLQRATAKADRSSAAQGPGAIHLNHARIEVGAAIIGVVAAEGQGSCTGFGNACTRSNDLRGDSHVDCGPSSIANVEGAGGTIQINFPCIGTHTCAGDEASGGSCAGELKFNAAASAEAEATRSGVIGIQIQGWGIISSREGQWPWGPGRSNRELACTTTGVAGDVVGATTDVEEPKCRVTAHGVGATGPDRILNRDVTRAIVDRTTGVGQVEQGLVPVVEVHGTAGDVDEGVVSNLIITTPDKGAAIHEDVS